MEVDAGFDLDAAARDAEIDRQRRAELERGFDLADAFGADADREEAAAAEQRDRETERPLPLAEVEPDFDRLRIERQGEPAPIDTCSSAKIPTATDGMFSE